jgi:hypothetical protein
MGIERINRAIPTFAARAVFHSFVSIFTLLLPTVCAEKSKFDQEED